MCRVGWMKLLIELSSVEAVNKQTQSAFKRMRATRKTSRRSCQPRQVMTQLSVTCFNRVSIGFTFRDFISSKVIPQAVIGIKCIAIILVGLRRIVYQFLDGWLSAFPDHFPTQITARLPVYDGQDVDPVFLWPIKLNNSSISAVLTSLGNGASGKLAALACTHNDTVRW